MENERITGTVCAVHVDRGFFFIAVGRRNHFGHVANIVGGLQPQVGDKCSFVVGAGFKPGTKQALDIVLEDAEACNV